MHLKAPKSGEHAVASWALLRWVTAVKPAITSVWAGAGVLLILSAGAVVSLAHNGAEWQVFFGWGLSGLAVIFACLQSWRLGLRWAVRNARRALIQSLSDSDEALFLTESNGRVIYDTDAFRVLVRSVNGEDLIGFANLASLAELIAPVSVQNFKRIQGQAADGKRDSCYIDISVGGVSYHWRVSVEPVGTLKWALTLDLCRCYSAAAV